VITYAEALARIATLPAISTVERVPLAAAAGRVLAGDVALDRDQPPFDRSTMDGYAVALVGDRRSFAVLGTVAAGVTWPGAVRPGEAVRIMTGALAPTGTTVVPIEATDGGVETVTVTEPTALALRRNIAWRGEDGRAGAVVLAAGMRLGPTQVAAAAMAGAREVAVHRAPRLGLVSTGDEVVGAGVDGAPTIADSNGPFLLAFAAALGLTATHRHARDDADALRAALTAAAADSDVVVTTGGVSAGDRDLVPAMSAQLGFVTVLHHVAMQPGKPVFVAARADGRHLVGLPGNPVSVLATAHLILLPVLARRLGGCTPAWLELPLAAPTRNRGRRQLFLPARLVPGGVQTVPWNGSGDLLAAAHGHGLVDLAPGADLPTGTMVRLLPYVGGGDAGLLPARAVRG